MSILREIRSALRKHETLITVADLLRSESPPNAEFAQIREIYVAPMIAEPSADKLQAMMLDAFPFEETIYDPFRTDSGTMHFGALYFDEPIQASREGRRLIVTDEDYGPQRCMRDGVINISSQDCRFDRRTIVRLYPSFAFVSSVLLTAQHRSSASLNVVRGKLGIF